MKNVALGDDCGSLRSSSLWEVVLMQAIAVPTKFDVQIGKPVDFGGGRDLNTHIRVFFFFPAKFLQVLSIPTSCDRVFPLSCSQRLLLRLWW